MASWMSSRFEAIAGGYQYKRHISRLRLEQTTLDRLLLVHYRLRRIDLHLITLRHRGYLGG